MKLYLVQHGLSESAGGGGEKTLTEKGREETSRIASVAGGYEVAVDRIVHSGKMRAEQTAAIFQDALQVSSPMQRIAGINPLDDVKDFAEGLNKMDRYMVVGHLPFMEKLVSFLTTGRDDFTVYKFQNSGIVCLSKETDDDPNAGWCIAWSLNPQIG